MTSPVIRLPTTHMPRSKGLAHNRL